MSDVDGDPAVALPLPLLIPSTPRSTRDLTIETSVVILVCIVPTLFSSIASLYLQSVKTPFLYQSLYSMVRSCEWIVLVLFMIFRSGEPLSLFGLKRFRIGPDLFGAIGVYILSRVAYRLLWVVIFFLEQHSLIQVSRHSYNSWAPPSGAGAYAILFVSSLSNGFAEEILVRAYLITRFEQLFESTGLALFFTTALFASYHIYQGTSGVISVACFGLVYGSLFCLFRRLWPLALAHAIWDFMSFAAMR
jgi:membrane protease YdiL (CAAX protease family)